MSLVHGVVLGVDVGWSELKKTTGVCLLEWDATSVRLTCQRIRTDPTCRQADLRCLIANRRLLAVAIDGPLRPDLKEIGEYRDAELMLTRQFQLIGKPGQSSSGNGRKLNRTANSVANTLLSLGVLERAIHTARIHDWAIVEAFPTSFMGVMLEEGRIPGVPEARSDVYFEYLLGPDQPRPQPPPDNRLAGLMGNLLPGRTLTCRLADLTNHEDRAAAVCALTALCVAVRRYVAVGDPRNGYIVLPPRARHGEVGLQPWAWRLLEGNRPVNAKTAIIQEPEEPGS
jgi:predicted RNase H-like nuclease